MTCVVNNIEKQLQGVKVIAGKWVEEESDIEKKIMEQVHEITAMQKMQTDDNRVRSSRSRPVCSSL